MVNHINVRYYLCEETSDNGAVSCEYCRSTEIIADNLIKPLGLNNFESLKSIIPMVSLACEPMLQKKENSENGGREHFINGRC